MATIKTAIALYDGVTSPLKSIHHAMELVLNSFEAMQGASKKAVDVAAIKAAREELAKAGTVFDAIEKSIRDADTAQQKLNPDMERGTTSAASMGDRIKSLVSIYAGAQAVRGLFGFAKNALSETNNGMRSDTQLRAVLANSGGGADTYSALKATASGIESRGIYDEGNMLAGTAELATYMKDQAAISSMMGTLSNYAIGMTGGGALDDSQMVDLATQLGKALNGTFDGLAKKGFELTDAQKEIIENGTDMQKALVLDEVINESWANLYDTMSNTPEGKVIQLQNRWNALMDEVGQKLYPVVLQLIATIEAHWGQIENVLNSVAGGAGVLIGIFDGLLQIASVMVDLGYAIAANWNVIAPILFSVVAAVVAYQVATKLAAAAQFLMNGALLACPITWIVIAILAVIAAIILVVKLINKVTGSSISAVGVICGALSTAFAFILNAVIGLLNMIIQLAWTMFVEPFIPLIEFILNVCKGGFDSFGDGVKNLLGNIISWFLSLGKVVTKIIDAIFGTDWTSGLSDLQDKVLEWGKNDKAITLSREATTINYRMTYSGAWDAGYSFGQNLENGFGFGDTLDFERDMEGIWNNTGDIAESTAATADALDISSEDLKYLRDIAEREVINRFTTAEIRIEQHNENHISSDMDVDGIMNAWADSFAERLDISAEGVHN